MPIRIFVTGGTFDKEYNEILNVGPQRYWATLEEEMLQ